MKLMLLQLFVLFCFSVLNVFFEKIDVVKESS